MNVPQLANELGHTLAVEDSKESSPTMKTMIDLFEIRNDHPLTRADGAPTLVDIEVEWDDVAAPTPSNRRVWSSEELP